ncbi:hydroxyphenylacetyl-CoA thioesterase PaaI [Kineobactrum salinum]|uniref:Hydroxyphenylacetyl-CoA thioesterase PaaI n=1 Tax=Kineobactrum salinum TaxID=2708301 RepID=A0A6C0U4C1_9GAMM|nr:hydroxyphenylacetyl-CoA thioesterase PaaI [Kineobactrum salinum]QIB66778.1 hydroxyphenylacetyl-CoA thioesterase PaaI [Kineobactrum salinum]
MEAGKQQLAQACGAALWVGDKACQAHGIELQEITAGGAVMSMTVRDDMVNGHAICHGGFIFALADSSFAYACNSENFNTVAAGARIEFLAPARLGETLTARARQVIQRGRTGLYDVEVSNQQGDVIALFRGNSHRIGGQLVATANSGDVDQTAGPATGEPV